jgi:hypothetical protein
MFYAFENRSDTSPVAPYSATKANNFRYSNPKALRI